MAVVGALALALGLRAAEIADTQKLPGTVEFLDVELRIDSSFGRIDRIQGLEDGAFLVAGLFNRVNGQLRSGFVRLLPNGSVDGSFAPLADPRGTYVAIEIDSKNRLVLASNSSIWRFLPSGESDPSFKERITETVVSKGFQSVRVLKDNSLLAAGGFELKGSGPLETRTTSLLRLREDGSVDPSLQRVGGALTDVLPLGNGDIVIAGWLPSKVDPTILQIGIQKLRQDGSVIPDFPFISVPRSLHGTDLEGNFFASQEGQNLRRYTPEGVSISFAGTMLDRPLAVHPAGVLLKDGRWASFAGGYGIIHPDGRWQDVPLSQRLWGQRRAIGVSVDRVLIAVEDVLTRKNRLAWVQMGDLPQTPPIILSHPSLPQRIFLERDSVELSIKAGPSTSPLSIQWEHDGNPIPHGKQETLVFRELQASDSGTYRAVLSNASGRVVSESIHLVVHPTNPMDFGALDLSFDAGPLEPRRGPVFGGSAASVAAVVVDGVDRIWIGGAFTKVGGVTRHNLARLLPHGAVDPQIEIGTNPNGKVSTLLLLANGAILLGGDFRQVGGETRVGLARLDRAGALDPSFALDTRFNSAVVQEVAELPTGRLVLRGEFTQSNGSSANIIRVHPDGALDEAFLPAILVQRGPRTRTSHQAMAVHANGWITVATQLCQDTMTGDCIASLKRLSPEGSLSELSTRFREPDQFNALVIGAEVRDLHLTSDDRLVVSGFFGQVNGVVRPGLARLAGLSLDNTFVPKNFLAFPVPPAVHAVEADGHLLISADELWAPLHIRTRVRRLRPDGSVDPSFRIVAPVGEILHAAVQDHRILLVGNFTQINGQPRHGIASLVGKRPNKQPRVLGPAMVEGKFSLSVLSLAERDYVLEFKDSLNDPAWTALTSLRGTGGLLELTDPIPRPRNRFYRVREHAKP